MFLDRRTKGCGGQATDAGRAQRDLRLRVTGVNGEAEETGRRGVFREGRERKKLRGVKARAQTDRVTWRVSASSPVMVHENRREGGGGKGRGKKGGGEGCANGRRDKREPQARTLSY